MMFISRVLLLAVCISGTAYAVPPTPELPPSPTALTADQILVTECAEAPSDGGMAPMLFELRGQRNGRNYYAHVIGGMETEIWFGQPARAPGRIVLDHDVNGPRTGPRWLIGHSPDENYSHQAFVDNDDPRPPRSGWMALFGANIGPPCLLLGPGPMPTQTMSVGVLGLALDMPMTFRKDESLFSGWKSVSFTDTATGTRWWVERRNCGIAFADPPDMTTRRQLRQAKGVTKLREVKKGPDATPLQGIPLPPTRTYFLYRHGDASYCSFYTHGGDYNVWTMGENEDRTEREALLERMCVAHSPGMFGFEGTVAEHLGRMMTTLPASPTFEGLEVAPGMLRFHDTAKKVWVKLVWRPMKGGSPYNDATDDNIRRRLKDQGCNARRVRPGTLGKRSGWRARCEFGSPLDPQKRVNVFTFASRGENVWLVTLWAEDWDWKAIETYADTLFEGVSLH